MAEITQLEYKNKDLVVLMLKDQGIHEGDWVLQVKFAFSAMNIGQSDDGSDASPAGIAAATGFAIARVPEPLPFSVNAAEVNPKK